VTRGEHEVLVRTRTPDDRQPVGRDGTQTAPHAKAWPTGERAYAAHACALDRVDPPLVDGQVETCQLERPGEPQRASQRGRNYAGLLQEYRDARILIAGLVLDVVALAALYRESETQVGRESRAPRAGGEHDCTRRKWPVGRLQRDAAATGAQRAHLRTSPHVGARVARGVADDADELERVARQLVRVVDGAGDRAEQRGLELGRLAPGEHLRPQPGVGVLRGLAAPDVETVLGLVDVERPQPAHAGAELRAELLVKRKAGE